MTSLNRPPSSTDAAAPTFSTALNSAGFSAGILVSDQPEVEAIVGSALDAKAEDAVLYDVREHSVISDYVFICNGRSPAHVRGIGERIARELKSKGMHSFSTEGLKEGSWVLLDYHATLVHVFHPDTRAYYDLDGLLKGSPCEQINPSPIEA